MDLVVIKFGEKYVGKDGGGVYRIGKAALIPYNVAIAACKQWNTMGGETYTVEEVEVRVETVEILVAKRSAKNN